MSLLWSYASAIIIFGLIFVDGYVSPNNVQYEEGLTENEAQPSSIVTDMPFSRSTMAKEKKCGLICSYQKFKDEDFPKLTSLWFCRWGDSETADCKKVDRTIMREAKTNDPEYPSLVKAANSSSFGIAFDANQNIRHLGDEFLADYPKIRFFYMLSNPLRHIKRGTFEGAKELEKILISNCPDFVKIEGYAFSTLSQLKYLYMHNSSLSKIESHHFLGLNKLISLQLNFSRIRKIDKEAFTALKMLEKFSVRNNELIHLHPFLFQANKKMKSLDLEGNMISSVPYYLLKFMENLEYISLRHNPLKTIPGGFLFPKEKLQFLYLGCCNGLRYEQRDCHNASLHLIRQSLVTQHSVDHIEIDGCLTDLLPNLHVKPIAFVLKGCAKITTLKQRMFHKMTKMINLTMSHGNITDIQKDTFHYKHNKQLHRLILDHNDIDRIQNDLLKHQTKLVFLKLSHNSINQIGPHSFRDLKSLEALLLDHNRIERIHIGTFSKCGSLKNLSLAYNEIKDLSQVNLTGLRNLKFLDLSHNIIGKISKGDFADLAKTAIQVEHLSLQGNRILTIDPASFDGMRFTSIDLSMNKLSRVKNVFTKHFDVKSVNLSHNQITEFGSEEFHKSDTRELFLQNNKMNNTDFVTLMPELATLDVSQNEITELSSSRINLLKRLTTLNLAGNPWICSCLTKHRHLMNFLLIYQVIPCCPCSCVCTPKADKISVKINCLHARLQALPSCLPYDEVDVNFGQNLLETVTLTQGLENMTSLNLEGNHIRKINGSSLQFLKKLNELNLKNNLLSAVPQELASLRYTKVLLEGNKFFCRLCTVIEILRGITWNLPQNISCAEGEDYAVASMECLFITKVLPYGLSIVLIVAMTILSYQFGRTVYMKKLAKRYGHIRRSMNKKEEKESFLRERTILQENLHVNIRHLHKTLTSWVPLVRRHGHFYLEPVNCSISEHRQHDSPDWPSLHAGDTSQQFLSAIAFLHSRDPPIYHCKLSIDNVFLKLDVVQQRWIVKLGDFSQAQVMTATISDDNETTPLIRASKTEACQRDLQAAAQIIFYLLSGIMRSDRIELHDVANLANADLCTVVLALQGGTTAEDALLTPAFQTAEFKISLLSELNALFKANKNNPTAKKTLVEAEENSPLVIGGRGSWNKNLDNTIMEDYGLGVNNHDLTSYVDQLRMIRNILQHPHENPKSMRVICGKENPNAEEVLNYFLDKFPFFYPHSYHCAYRFMDGERAKMLPKSYFAIYREFESFVCQDGTDRKLLEPLRENGHIKVEFHALDEAESWQIPCKGVKSSVDLKEILSEMKEHLAKKSVNLFDRNLVMKYRGELIHNPLVDEAKASNEKGIQNMPSQVEIMPCTKLGDKKMISRLCVPEGSTLQILKPEIRILFPRLGVQPKKMEFRHGHNVKAIKGFVKGLRIEGASSQMTVTHAEKQLTDKQQIAELRFIEHEFLIEFLQSVL